MLENSAINNSAYNKPKTEDLALLQTTWEQAYERLHSASTRERIDTILNVTALQGIDNLKKYLISHGNDLKPEEKHFVEMSIRLKMYPEAGKTSKEAKSNSSIDLISDEEFQNFVSSNFISVSNLESIANKIIENKILSERELAVYSEKSNEIENLIKLKFIKN